ncbi:hypothetical protein BVRB_5g126380 [Beta vulgaris subsp. vulgaris]|uniref:Aspartic peptidase DDI1-type domain-containing protein n=1 Tax=Beta vulgaris subsp. vulgaris TaxID=3555 RepID=A0A0J8E372_BETVV|nr:hypothetical protein BVRB_5g126380 [Beta vulgaris subsp. vulgaris]
MQSGSSNKPYERKDKGKDKTFFDGKPKNRHCFLCGGPHFARECPQRQKLNAIVAAHDQKSEDETQMGTLRLLSSVKATIERPKGEGDIAKVCTLPRIKKSSLMFVEAVVNGRTYKALVDMSASHNFVAEKEAARLMLRYAKELGVLKTVNTSPVPIHGIARSISLHLGEWKGTIDHIVVPMDDFSLVLGIEFMDSVKPWTFEKGRNDDNRQWL